MKRLYILIDLFLAITVVSFFFLSGTSSHAGLPSSELQQLTSEDGNVTRVDYMLNGVLTYATDRHYATLLRTKTGNTLLEQYYDENGRPAQQTSGYYALLREYDENKRNYKLTFLGPDLEPVLNTAGYSTWIRSYNEQGLTETERYYGVDGSPVATKYGYYARRLSYEDQRNTETVYLDRNDEPVVCELGYAILKRTFYENGRTENEFYYDDKGLPIALQDGAYGIHREYDEEGRNCAFTYLGINGEPILIRSGYATVKRTFYPDNSVKTEMYYDAEDQPVALTKGQYGTLRADGKTILLDADGEPFFHLGNFLYGNPVSVPVLGLIVVLLSVIAGRRGNTVLLVLYLVFILYMTLMERSRGDMRANLEIFWSYKQILSSSSLRFEILSNIWLFIPLGAILYSLTGEPWSLILPVLLSASIEVTQYFTGFGLAEIDDVISNGLGGIIGSRLAAGRGSVPRLRKRSQLTLSF